MKNSKIKIEDISQDEDVLDTWFSSWLWPMEVFKGISNPGNEEAKYYYPSTTLVTGQDIIFFWVARMIMAGYEYEDKKPFNDVYFTGMVRDKQGRKMSKQLGNSPDLLGLIDQYGADATRFGIMISSPAGNDLLFDESALEQGRNFNNKMWNALKLIKMLEGRVVDSGQLAVESEGRFALDWFENRLNEVRASVDGLMKEFKLSEALKIIYSLVWDDFCSWYLEWVKPGFEQPISSTVYRKTVDFFEQLMQLLHPYMPFVTEEIYHLLKKQDDDLCVKQFSEILAPNHLVLEHAVILQETITAIRDVRNKQQIKPKETIALHIQTEEQAVFESIREILAKQVNASAIAFTSVPVADSITSVQGKNKFYIETEQPLNTGGQKDELLKELDYLKGFLQSVEKKLNNEKFVQNAKPEVVALEQKKLADAQEKIRIIQESLAAL